MRNLIFFLVIASMLLMAGCSNREKTNANIYNTVFKKGHKYAIAKTGADTSRLVYKYDKVEIQASGWHAYDRRPWENAECGKYEKDMYFKVLDGFNGYGICKNDSLIIPCIYDDFFEENNHCWEVRKDTNYGLFGKDGKIIFSVKYHSVYSNDACPSVIDHNDNVLMYTGKKIIGPFYNISCFDGSKGIFLFEDRSKTKSGIINSDGQKIMEVPYTWIRPVGSGLYKVGKRYHNDIDDDALIGFVDSSGKIIVPFQKARYLGELNNGIITYDNKTDCGYYDIHGKKTSFKDVLKDVSLISEFSNGTAIAMNKDQKYGLIDQNGKFIVPCDYTSYLNFDNEAVCFKKNNITAKFSRKTGKVIRFI